MRTYVSVLVSLFLAACGGQEKVDVASGGPSQSTTIPASDPAATQTSALSPPAAIEKDEPSSRPPAATPMQEVHLIEYSIHMPDTLPAGRVAFNVENGGKEDHGLEIEGNGVHQETKVLKRGDTASLELDLKPGTYTVYCPVDGHKDKGMRKTITVK